MNLEEEEGKEGKEPGGNPNEQNSFEEERCISWMATQAKKQKGVINYESESSHDTIQVFPDNHLDKIQEIEDMEEIPQEGVEEKSRSVRRQSKRLQSVELKKRVSSRPIRARNKPKNLDYNPNQSIKKKRSGSVSDSLSQREINCNSKEVQEEAKKLIKKIEVTKAKMRNPELVREWVRVQEEYKQLVKGARQG
jgi:hypothetical protein